MSGMAESEGGRPRSKDEPPDFPVTWSETQEVVGVRAERSAMSWHSWQGSWRKRPRLTALWADELIGLQVGEGKQAHEGEFEEAISVLL
jgi:hypothetical protein